MYTRKMPQPLRRQNRISAISILCNCNPALTEFIFHHKRPKLRLTTPKLLEESQEFDREDQMIIRASIDFWNRTAHTQLNQMLDYWDPYVWMRFVQAICHLKEVRQDVIERLMEDEERGFPLPHQE